MGSPRVDGTEQPERDQPAVDQSALDQSALDQSDDAILAELRTVEDELESLRAQARALRSPIGGRDSGPMDLAENAAQLTLAEEQEALIEVLENRRDALVRKLEARR
ncbi:MAG: hypothetical protein IRY85_09310 [Micromonosporaceae bacterium]|nr:hypothetical protein [Micromonosporaceae bacterium]